MGIEKKKMAHRLLVVGGQEMLGSAICRAAVRAGVQVTSLSNPAHGVQQQAPPTAKWANRVVGDPLDVAMVEQVVHESTAVISTIGASMESPLSEQKLKDLLSELQSPSTDKLQELYSQLQAGNIGGSSKDTHNRDIHLTVAAVAAKSEATNSFVFISASPPSQLAKITNAPFFEAKAAVERELLSIPTDDLRCIVLRSAAVFSEQALDTLPVAAMAQASQIADKLLSNPLALAEQIGDKLKLSVSSESSSLTIPRGDSIHVNTLADAALEAALRPDVSGVVEMPQIFELAEDSQLPAVAEQSASETDK